MPERAGWPDATRRFIQARAARTASDTSNTRPSASQPSRRPTLMRKSRRGPLRAGHDDIVSGRRREGREMGTSGNIMLTSECCRQQSASSDANFLHPPAHNFLLAATDFLFDRWQHYHIPIVHLELSTSKSGPFCRHIAYLSGRRSNGVAEIMPRALNK